MLCHSATTSVNCRNVITANNCHCNDLPATRNITRQSNAISNVKEKYETSNVKLTMPGHLCQLVAVELWTQADLMTIAARWADSNWHKQEAKSIWQRRHWMFPCTWYAAYTTLADAAWQTDWQMHTVNIGKNSQHLMHSMQPNNIR